MQVGLFILFDRFERIQDLMFNFLIYRTTANMLPIRKRLTQP